MNTERTRVVAKLATLALGAALLVALTVVFFAPPDQRAQGAVPGEPSATLRALRGVPQDGIALGEPDAPVTIVEFADLQCPFCAQFHAQAFPGLLERYVKSGKVRIELNLLRFVGPDSDRLARTAAGAAATDRMWQVAGLAYERQGHENSGYATDEFLDELTADAGLGALDPGPSAERIVAAAEGKAGRARIDSTPSFLIGPTGGELRRFQPSSLALGEFAARIDQDLRR
jgi:protein-disulfide isomerase